MLGNTFKEWRDNWAMKGKDVARVHVQQAYSQAPEDLKLAVGMWLDYVPEITYNRSWVMYRLAAEVGHARCYAHGPRPTMARARPAERSGDT